MTDAPGRLGPRVVLAASLCFGAAFLWSALPDSPLLGANFRVYRAAADAAFAGQSMYGVVPAGLADSYVYLYPPVTVVGFLPFILLSWPVGYAVFTLFSLAAGTALAYFCGHYVERARPLGRVDYLLLGGFTLGSSLAVPSLLYGNVNVILAFLVGAAFMAHQVETEGADRVAGVALAVPALTKAFPTGFGLWYLRERAWRPLKWAVATGVGLLVVGLLLFGVDAHATYVESVLLARLRGDVGAGVSYVTVRRPLSHVVPATLLTPAAALVIAPVLAAMYVGDLDDHGRLLALLATLACVVVFVPAYPLYLLFLSFPLLPALYLVEHRVARPALLAGAALLPVTVQANDLPRLVAATGVAELTALRPLLSVATPPLWGVGLILVGCLAYRYT